MKIKLLIILLVLLVSSIFFISNNKDNKSELNPKINTLTSIEEHEEINVEKEVIKDESNNKTITNNKQDNNKTSGISSNPSGNDNSNDKKSNSNSNNYVVEETKEVDYNSTQVEKNSTKEENHSTQQEEQKNPWDDLGITKDDYYNKPMWSWARVDYSITEYKTIEKTQQACIDAGNNMMEEILSFSCISINSYSGDYLGEMLRVKY